MKGDKNMAKIEISTIREAAASLQELNAGYLLYQNQGYEDFEFEIIKIPTLSFNATAIFDDHRVSLHYGQKPEGDCSCKGNGLCRHEVCLFFLLRDKLNEIFADKKSESEFFNNARQDEMMQELMEINITRNVFKYELKPIISLEGDKLLLQLLFNCERDHKTIFDVEKFLASIENKQSIDINGVNYLLDYKYFDQTSQKLLDLCYLNRLAMKPLYEHTIINEEFLTFLYTIYKEYIYYSDGTYPKKLPLKEEMPKIKVLVDGTTISLNNLNFRIIITHSKSFVFMSDACFVISGADKIFATLLKNLYEKKELRLTEENLEIFINNIYPYYDKYIVYTQEKKVQDIKINTYFTYQNKRLSIKYEGDFKEGTFYLKKKNYKLLIRNLGFVKSNNYTINDFDLICDIITNKIDEFKKYGDVFLSESINRLKFINMNNQRLKIKMNASIISLTFEGMEYSADELKDILIAYKDNRRYLELDNGEIVRIDEENAKLYQELVDEIGLDKISEEIKIPLYQAYFITSRYHDLINSNELLNKFSNDLINYHNYDAKPSNSLTATLREYQLDGFKWLRILSEYNLGGILADDMGLGKTIEIISLIDTLPRDRAYLIVAPTSLIFNWKMEFEKFAPHLPVKVIYGITRTKEEIVSAYENNMILITSYESVRMDIEKYKGLSFKVMVIDEAQYIKNPDALKTLAVKMISADAKFALTGTPIENSLLDLWSIFDFVLPSYLKSKSEFIRQYENTIDKNLLEELNRKTSPFILRRLKGEVLDLEDKVENYSFSFMTPDERKLYDAYLLNAQAEINSPDFKISHVLSLLTRLRELACEPRLFLDNVNTPNSKMDLLMETIEQKIEDGHKILVFSQFTSIFPFMQKRLEDKKIEYLVLTGKTDPKTRMELVDKFNGSDSIKVFLISLKAGGTGLNLTSADTVIHYDPWWNIAAMNQATDRAHRIGQRNVVNVIKMINKNTIEEKIVELQNHKKYLSQEVINDEDVIKHMTKEEIKELFK